MMSNSGIIKPKDGQPIELDSGEEGPCVPLSTPTAVAVEITPESTRIAGVEGYPFILGDGRIWDLARPSLRIRPHFVDGKVLVENRWDYPKAEREKVQAFIDAVDQATNTVSTSMIVETAWALLRRCHRLEPEYAVSLFELSIGEIEDIAVGMLRMFRGFTPVESDADEPSSEVTKAE